MVYSICAVSELCLLCFHFVRYFDRTEFTRTKRYTYVDPDYEFDEDEDKKRSEHRQKYVDFIKKRMNRTENKGKTL